MNIIDVCRDKQGRIVVAQKPNWQIIIAFVFYVAARFLPDGQFARTAYGAFLIFLAVWAYEELVRGVSLFRRALGATVLVLTIIQTGSII